MLQRDDFYEPGKVLFNEQGKFFTSKGRFFMNAIFIKWVPQVTAFFRVVMGFLAM